MGARIEKKHPKGSVLMFTLVVLTLMALLGASIMVNTRTELNITSNNAVGQEAFNRADSTLAIALMLTRQLAKEFDATEIKAPLDKNQDGLFKVVTCQSTDCFQKNKLPGIGEVTTIQSIKDRYLAATDAAFSHDSSSNPKKGKVIEPFIKVYRVDETDKTNKDKMELIGTATATIGNSTPMSGEGVGGSIGESKGDPSDGTNIKIYYVVTADGRVTRAHKDDESAANYYTGNQQATHSVITTIYKDLAY
ncbi:MAG: pilus assembly PilX N-terminal domain-containing protein [Candidatus Adiutrix sp.]|nr:pilus assembly PilX N-terminal domain-containing protein [Candidatus Adiutrix sp.]